MTTRRIDLTLRGIRPDPQLQYENYQVVSAVQALLGAITSNMNAVALSCVDEDVHLHFWLKHESAEDRKIIGEISDDLEALQFTDVRIITHVEIGLLPAQRPGRPLYLRCEQ